MEVVLFTLVLYINDAPKEWMAYWEDPVTKEWSEMGLPGCLAMKRTLKRQGWHDTKGGRYACEKRVVETRINWEDKKVIARIVE
tara:strand:- start:248 stop:499 length:252 start_codon:yes stop_codon:yes gene_type:complete